VHFCTRTPELYRNKPAVLSCIEYITTRPKKLPNEPLVFRISYPQSNRDIRFNKINQKMISSIKIILENCLIHRKFI
jgi:hypothetical protein